MTTPGRILTRDDDLRPLVRSLRRVAVLGIRSEAFADRPAFYVPEYLARAGVEIVPVPVYYPDVTEILGKPVVRSLTQVEGEIDVLDVFRRPDDLAAHEAEILALAPKVVWLQTGIRLDALAERLSAAGIDVVQDRCLMVEHRRLSLG
jgi:predicted CoA-binding protein